MTPKTLTDTLSVSPQLSPDDIDAAAATGFGIIINNRPDGEEPGQPRSADLAARAAAAGIAYAHIPVVSGQIDSDAITAFGDALSAAEGKALAFCRTGTRSTTLWALGQASRLTVDEIVGIAATAGYDLAGLRPRLSAGTTDNGRMSTKADVVIVGGGSAGLATAASLLERRRDLDIVVIEPRTEHYYQPGWTMVGGGVFDHKSTCRQEASVMPSGVRWVRGAVATFQPDRDEVTLEDGTVIGYRALVVAPGIALVWDAIEGLSETLGKNGVTSNYSYDTAPYTWQLVKQLKQGVALFTQPPMPIKCAGAPQKAMYLSCDHWRREGTLGDIEVAFHNAGAVLFGVKEYVPALMTYVERYGIDLQFESTLIAVDGPNRRATFKEKAGEVTKSFDMLHVTPLQKAPAFIAQSPLANAGGYVDVDQASLQHVRYANVFGLGDGGSTPNAKTMAAARKQAPVVAENVIAALSGRTLDAVYDGYGSCPLTVERGKIVLAEFGYGGKLLPSFPRWLIDGTRPQRLSWLLKSEALPWIYWNGMLKGREWMAHPAHRVAA
jgi:sulfide:quinone oxidoreductase